MIALEDLEEAGLGTGRPLHAAARQRRDAVIEVGEVEHEILHPERRALADRRRLGRLQMRVTQRRLGTPLAREGGQRAQHTNDTPAQQLEPAPHDDQVGVVGDERTRGTEVDELVRRGGHVAKGVDVSHHVVPEAPLVDGHLLEVDVVEVRAHLRQRLIRDRHPQPLLGLGEGEPEAPPESVPHAGRPQLQHRRGRVALGERGGVTVVRRHRITKSV